MATCVHKDLRCGDLYKQGGLLPLLYNGINIAECKSLTFSHLYRDYAHLVNNVLFIRHYTYYVHKQRICFVRFKRDAFFVMYSRSNTAIKSGDTIESVNIYQESIYTSLQIFHCSSKYK